MSLNKIILETKDLSVRFGGLSALIDLEVQIKEGEILGLIGPNGSGKTTFLNLISRIYTPSWGTIIYQGEDIVSWAPYEVMVKGISRTFQNIRIFSNASVIENVMVGYHCKMDKSFLGVLFNTKHSKQVEKDARERAITMLEFVNLSGKETEIAKNLSYGEQRRLEVARALASDPKLILLDEPTAGMNVREAGELMDLFRAIREQGKSILIIEHNMKVVMNIAERIVVLDSGTKIAEGPPELIQADSKVAEAYLGKEED